MFFVNKNINEFSKSIIYRSKLAKLVAMETHTDMHVILSLVSSVAGATSMVLRSTEKGCC
jgi:hypothetical protein